MPRPLGWVVALALALGGCGGGDGGDGDGGDGDGDGGDGRAFAELYAEDALPTFELTIPPDCEEALERTPDVYCAGDLRYVPGTTTGSELVLTNVGIRLKGSASFRTLGQKAAFKIKVDEFVAGQRLLGLRRLTLNNMVQDPSMVHERLGYRYLRAAGVPAPLCNHARVWVNGEYYGLYANVQTLDDEFAEALWSPAPGNLYDIPTGEYFYDLLPEYLERYDLETNQAAADRSDLAALITALGGDAEQAYLSAGEHLDWAEWLTLGAAQAVIADWDGYFGARNNYKLYHELQRDRFVLLPWGIDQTFGITDGAAGEPLFHFDYRLDHSTSEREPGYVLQRCQRAPACWERYLDAVEAAVATFEGLPLASELDAIVAQTEDARLEDERKEHSDRATTEYRDALRTFLAERGARVRADLAREGR